MGLGIVLVWNIGYGMIMTSKFLCALGGVGWHGYGAPWHWGGSGFFIDRSPWHWGRALIANPWKGHHHPDIEEISTTLLVDHDVVGWSKWSYKIGFNFMLGVEELLSKISPLCIYKTSIYQSNRNIWYSLWMYLNRQSMLEKLPAPNMQTIRAPSWPRELIGGKKRPSLSFPGRRAPSPIDGLPPFSLFLFQHLKTSMIFL